MEITFGPMTTARGLLFGFDTWTNDARDADPIHTRRINVYFGLWVLLIKHYHEPKHMMECLDKNCPGC